jgi:ketosteroid isomerase-like protein
MTFRETLDAHLRAIQGRDLDALIATLPPESLMLVMSDGTVARTTAEFVEAHRGWFAAPSWTIDFEEVHAVEADDLAVATFHLHYRNAPAGAPPIHERSVLTLAFARRGDRWVMVLDQNTPIRSK